MTGRKQRPLLEGEVQILIRLGAREHDQLKTLADAEDRTMTAQARYLLREAIRQKAQVQVISTRAQTLASQTLARGRPLPHDIIED